MSHSKIITSKSGFNFLFLNDFLYIIFIDHKEIECKYRDGTCQFGFNLLNLS